MNDIWTNCPLFMEVTHQEYIINPVQCTKNVFLGYSASSPTEPFQFKRLSLDFSKVIYKKNLEIFEFHSKKKTLVI